MTQSRKTIELDYACLEFYENTVIGTIKEGMNFEKEQLEQFRELCEIEFGSKSFIYISNRKYDYSINPIIYIDLIKKDLLKGIGIISEKPKKIDSANFEKNFSPVPYQIFSSKEEALIWADKILSSQ